MRSTAVPSAHGRLSTAPARALAMPLALGAVLAGLLTGCQQEMLKATPFASGEYERAEGPPQDRVNLWPIFYHRAPATSILWPLGEVTDTTWAFRPIVASYDGKVDALWPFIHVDGRKGEGYVLPVVGWGSDWLLILPVYYGSPSTTAVLPFAIAYDDPRKSEFWTPLYGRGRSKPGAEDESWTYTPLFYTGSKGTSRLSMLPPLLSWWSTDSAEDRWDAQLFLSLAGIRRGPGHTGEHILPLYWRDSRHGSEFLMALPVYVGSDRSRGSVASTLRLFPLLLSGWGETFEPDSGVIRERTGVYGPLYILHRSPQVTTRAVPLLLSWLRERAGGGTDVHLLLSLVAWGGTSDAPFSRAIPIYYASGSDAEGSFGLPLLLYGSEWGPRLRRHMVIPLYDWEAQGEKRKLELLLGLAATESSPEHAAHHVFPLYWWSRGPIPTGVDPGASPSPTPASQDSPPPVPPDSSSPEPPSPAPVESGTEEDFHLLLLLYDTLDREHADGTSYHRARVLWRLWHDETVGNRRALDVFPFFTYDREGEESVTWSWLYTFLRYERKGDERWLNLFFLPKIAI